MFAWQCFYWFLEHGAIEGLTLLGVYESEDDWSKKDVCILEKSTGICFSYICTSLICALLTYFLYVIIALLGCDINRYYDFIEIILKQCYFAHCYHINLCLADLWIAYEPTDKCFCNVLAMCTPGFKWLAYTGMKWHS